MKKVPKTKCGDDRFPLVQMSCTPAGYAEGSVLSSFLDLFYMRLYNINSLRWVSF